MKYIKYSDQSSENNKIIFDVLSMDPLTIRDILNIKPKKYEVEGVYFINTPDDKEIVYVGKTRSKSIIGRLRDHKNIDTKSDMKGMLKLFPKYTQELNDYLVRYVEIPDERDRTFFEYYAIGLLKPTFNK